MSKIVTKSVTVWNDKSGRYETFYPGDRVPTFLLPKITNPKVFAMPEEMEEIFPGENKSEELPENLEDYTVAQLRDKADEDRIDISGLSRKAELVEAIKNASN